MHMPTLKKLLIGVIISILIIYMIMYLLVHYVTPTQHVIEGELKTSSVTNKP